MTQQSTVQSSGSDNSAPARRAIFDYVGARNLSLLVALAILVAIFGSTHSEIFFQPRNLTNILNAVAILGLIASAQTIVIISGGIDVSVGSIVGVSGVAAALTMLNIDTPLAGIVVALVVGMLCGLVNGLLVTWGHVNPIIATLATMAIFQGDSICALERARDWDFEFGVQLDWRRQVDRHTSSGHYPFGCCDRAYLFHARYRFGAQYLRHRRQSQRG